MPVYLRFRDFAGKTSHVERRRDDGENRIPEGFYLAQIHESSDSATLRRGDDDDGGSGPQSGRP